MSRILSIAGCLLRGSAQGGGGVCSRGGLLKGGLLKGGSAQGGSALGECLLPGGLLLGGWVGVWSWGVPGGDPPNGYCCGWYASYRNAFLFKVWTIWAVSTVNFYKSLLIREVTSLMTR